MKPAGISKKPMFFIVGTKVLKITFFNIECTPKTP